MNQSSWRCLWVQPGDRRTSLRIGTVTSEALAEQVPDKSSVTIDVRWSSLNYKDALAASGHPGVVKRLPHIPGIDAAGAVVQSESPQFNAGDNVLVTGYDLGQGHWGGWCQRICVPADWVVPLPVALSTREAMILGTAGFTAAQCVMALQVQDVMPGTGQVVVTGASGGVGSLAVRLLLRLGYRVVAVTGKPDWHERLAQWGVQQVLDRSEMADQPDRPLLAARWAGAIDTVGGPLVQRLIKETRYGGCVATCGLVAGADLQLSLYPFLLRGVSLCGVASADCPRQRRLRIWELLAEAWKPADLQQAVREVGLEDLPAAVDSILGGEVAGRVIVNPSG